MITMDILKKEIDTYLEECLVHEEGYNNTIYEAMSYSLNIGGKRIRPILSILTYNLFKADWEKILPFAAAIEMIHTYSLIHDDLPCMDNDDLRRGKPTNHKVFGEAVAVLAGDGLLNEAFNIMIKYSLKNGWEGLKATEVIGIASGADGMIGGQIKDILSQNMPLKEEELQYIHSKKTAALIKGAIVAGAILGNASEEDIKVLEIYGESLGLAFQIKDDILDIEGDVSKLGKNINSDANNNKYTYVSLLGLEESKELCRKLTDRCIEALTSLEYNTEALLKLTNYLLERNY